MKIRPFTLFFNVLLSLIIFGQFVSVSFAYDLCVPQGYTFGFFNGIRKTFDEAVDILNVLRDTRGSTFNNEKVQYEVFYNYSNKVDELGHIGLQDFAEVWEQRAAEIDSSGELGKRWELFWENLSGEKTLTNKIIGLFPSIGSLFSSIYSDIVSKSMAGWSYLMSNPPTASDYIRHNTRLDALAVQRQKLILVAHSQGNLFVNQAYDHIVPIIGANSVKVVHIAPASTTTRGEHLLAYIDLVINALRLQGISTVPEANLQMLPDLLKDPTGHGMLETYYDASRAGRNKVNEKIDSAMQALTTPTSTNGNGGSFTITMTWDGTGDVDLHTFEPNGTHVYYSAKTGRVGYLDVDNVVSDGPEHYYASCDSNVLEAGVYHVGINNYYNATGRTATVQIATSTEGVLATKTLGVGTELGPSGNASPIPVFDITVTKDMTGKVSFSAE